MSITGYAYDSELETNIVATMSVPFLRLRTRREVDDKLLEFHASNEVQNDSCTYLLALLYISKL